MKSASDDQPRGRKRAPAVRQRLVAAFKGTFTGHGSKEDASMVLTHLAQETGFFHVTPPDAPDTVRAYTEGRRSAYLIIHQFLSMSGQEIAELAEAVRRESIATMEEGEL